MSARTYLSIGDVLSLLREEFPDVTISKIRFLESQGLVNPERSPSGYRKFYEQDVERLRWVLRQQRENFLPLKVIRDRLTREDDAPAGAGTGRAASTTGPAPAAVAPAATSSVGAPPVAAAPDAGHLPVEEPDRAPVPEPERAPVAATVGASGGLLGSRSQGELADPEHHRTSGNGGRGAVRTEELAVARAAGGATGRPGAVRALSATPTPQPAPAPQPSPREQRPSAPAVPAPDQPPRPAPTRSGPEPATPAQGPATPPPAVQAQAPSSGPPPPPGGAAPPAGEQRPTAPPGVSGSSMTLEELCAASGLAAAEVASLEGFGLVEPMAVAGILYYDEEALVVARLVAAYRQYGIEPRHLRLYRNAVDREMGLVEQVVTPLLRQRNPEARQRAGDTAADLARLGQQLRSSLLRRELRRQLGT